MTVPLAGRSNGVRAAVFDLERTVIDARRAWCYTLEQAVAATTGARIDARPLLDGFAERPWAAAVAVLLDEPAARSRCIDLCREIAARSALKHLLVREGIGMGLDRLRSARIEAAAVSRLAPALARAHIQSTGTDRFFAFIAAAGDREWQPLALSAECAEFMARPPGEVALVSDLDEVLIAASAAGFVAIGAAWAGSCSRGRLQVTDPRDLAAALARLEI